MPSIVKLSLETNQYERNLKNAKKQWDDFTKSIGINMKSLSKVAVSAGAVTTALKVMKDAFYSSQTNIDEWGRTVESAKGLYEGFINSLNNSDFTGFLSRIDQIVSAARSAYDAISDLQMYTAFNQKNVAQGQANYAQALDEYKLNPTAENKAKLSQANEYVINQLKDAQTKADAAYRETLQGIAVSRLKNKEQQDRFVDLFANKSYDEFLAAGASFKSGKGLNAGSQYYYGDKVYDGRIQDRGTGIWRALTDAEKDQFEFARAISQVTKDEVQKLQAYGAQSVQFTQQIYQQDRQYNRMAGNNAKPTKSSGGSNNAITYAADSVAAQQELVSKLSKMWREAGAEVRNSYVKPLADAEALLKKMQEEQILLKEQSQGRLLGGDIQTSGLGSVVGLAGVGGGLSPKNLPQILSPLQQINAEIARTQELMQYAPTSDVYQEMNEHLQELLQKQNEFTGGGKKVTNSWNAAAGAISNVGSALNGIQDPAAKIMSLVAQAIASVAAGAGQAISAKDTTASGWAWIGAAAAIVGEMVAIISTIHSATGYATGGEIKGNTYSGDQIPIMANAGEIILNRSQQASIASQIQGNGLSGLQLEAVVYGEQLRFVLNSNGRRTGRGEYVTSNFR